MAKQYPAGDQIKQYTIIEHRGSGECSTTYLARSELGQNVFLKQFKSPTVRVPWYRAYVDYQEKIKHRVERSSFRDYSYRLLEFFEFGRCYFQAFEYLQGIPLQQALEICARRPEQASGEVRLRMARMLLGGIEALHGASIVHTDLKPENIMLLRNERGVYHKLRIIDLDVSLLLQEQAPWLKERGFFGTPGYLSPEHLRGETPEPASDVFTCGLMLYELLAQGHPYRFEDDEDYRRAVLGQHAAPPVLFSEIASLPLADHLLSVLHDCLHPVPEKRPSASELSGVLIGKAPTPELRGPIPIAPLQEIVETVPLMEANPPELDVNQLPMAILEPEESAEQIAPAERGLPIPGTARLFLQSSSGRSISFGLRTELGRAILKRLGPDSAFWAEIQCVLDRNEAGWHIVPRQHEA